MNERYPNAEHSGIVRSHKVSQSGQGYTLRTNQNLFSCGSNASTGAMEAIRSLFPRLDRGDLGYKIMVPTPRPGR